MRLKFKVPVVYIETMWSCRRIVHDLLARNLFINDEMSSERQSIFEKQEVGQFP